MLNYNVWNLLVVGIMEMKKKKVVYVRNVILYELELVIVFMFDVFVLW